MKTIRMITIDTTVTSSTSGYVYDISGSSIVEECTEKNT